MGLNTNNYIFVYGTLRKETGSDMYRFLTEHADFVAKAVWQGILYEVDYYPGAVRSNNATDLVKGEVYALHEPETVLTQLDKYEECGSGFPEPAEYIRRQMEVILTDGSKCLAWVYIYNWSTENLKRIESGDFLTGKYTLNT